MTINRLNQGTTNQVLVKAISGQTTNLLELQDSSGNVVSSIGPTGALGGTVSQPQGLVHIETRTVTASASESFNNVFSATYNNYKIMARLVGSGNIDLYMRFRTGGTDNSSSLYQKQEALFDTSSASITRTTNQNTLRIRDVRTAGTYHIAEIASPFLSEPTGIWSAAPAAFASTTPYFEIQGAGFNGNTSFDGFTLYLGSGNMTGTVSVYGYAKA
jgi:hypothetical protein